MIKLTRPRLLQVARALARARCRPGVDDPDKSTRCAAGDFVSDALGWRQAYDRQMDSSVRPLRQRRNRESAASRRILLVRCGRGARAPRRLRTSPSFTASASLVVVRGSSRRWVMS